MPRREQAVEKLPWCPLSPQIGHQTHRFWDVFDPFVVVKRTDADFFNRLGNSRKLAGSSMPWRVVGIKMAKIVRFEGAPIPDEEYAAIVTWKRNAMTLG